MSKRRKIITLLQEGKPVKEICQSLDVSKFYVYSVRHQIKLSKIKKENRKRKLRRQHMLELTCCKCKKTFLIRTNNPDIYTDEVVKNWKCLNCSYK
mgnify:CR=1 FL=1